MRAVGIVISILVAAFLAAGGRLAYRAAGKPKPLSQAAAAPAEDAGPPVVEYREMQTRAGGETGRLLTIDREGNATLQEIPEGPGSKRKRTRLECNEVARFAEQIRDLSADLRAAYGGMNTGNQGEVSVLYRRDGLEKRVVWRNPPSKPKPPIAWDLMVREIEYVARQTEEGITSALHPEKDLIRYGERITGELGGESDWISIDKTGFVVAEHSSTGHYMPGKRPTPRGQTQLTPEELATLLRAIREAKFVDFHQCYGKHAWNDHTVFLTYYWAGDKKDVSWMSPRSGPKPPDGWFPIVKILDDIWQRTYKQSLPPFWFLRDASLTLTNATGYKLSVELDAGFIYVPFEVPPGHTETRKLSSGAYGAYQVRGTISRPHSHAFSAQWILQERGQYNATFSLNSQGDLEVVLAPSSGGPSPSRGPQRNQLWTDRFKLLIHSTGFLLQFVSNGKTKGVAIPRDWHDKGTGFLPLS